MEDEAWLACKRLFIQPCNIRRPQQVGTYKRTWHKQYYENYHSCTQWYMVYKV